MKMLDKLREMLLGKTPLTAENTPPHPSNVAARVDEIPPFSLPTADLMRFDPQVRIGLGARNGMLLQGKVNFTAERPEVQQWLQRQWQRLWSQHGHQLIKAKLYGYLPLEVMYEETDAKGTIEVASLRDQHPRSVNLLTADGRVVGFETKTAAKDKPVKVLAPKALVCTFDAEFGNPYGCSLLERAYPAWFEKWTDGGAKKALRLRMMKDAYIGDILWYPAGRTIHYADGREVSWRQVAKEILDHRMTGSAMTLPMMFDDQGRKLVDYTPPQEVKGGTQIFAWKQDVDHEIWKALEMPPEVIEASTSGSGYSGRWIPLTIALGAVQAEFNELLACVDRDILRPIAQWNFGNVKYDVQPASFVELFSEMN